MSKYEFSTEQNRTIHKVSTRMIVQGILLALGGAIGIITDFVEMDTFTTPKLITTVIQSALFIVMGVLIFRPSDNFKRITKTEGKDIEELMRGVKEMNLAVVMSIILLILIVSGDFVGMLF